MRETGWSKDELFSFLSQKKGEDTPYECILSSMCTRPHPIAVQAHELFIEANLGDPGLYKGTASLERLLVKRIGALLHHPDAGGYATSGGTESNIQALRIAKKMNPVKNPNVIVPESAHFSFEKTCDMLSLEQRTIPVDATFRMDIHHLESSIDANTVCIVAIAGSTEYGTVDPISEISSIAKEKGIFLHIDAAFGGMVLPFIDRAPPFDFSLPGVSSISVDPHKMGMSTIPTGCFLVRSPDMLNLLNVSTPYLTVKQEFTLTGTRSGGSIVGALAVLEYLGYQGLKAIVTGCMKNTDRLIQGMETLGIPPAVKPDVNVATFCCTLPPPQWSISWTRRGHLRIVCMPHVYRETIEAFLEDMGEMIA